LTKKKTFGSTNGNYLSTKENFDWENCYLDNNYNNDNTAHLGNSTTRTTKSDFL